MAEPVPGASRRTPLPSAIGAQMNAGHLLSAASSLPTVEEVSAGGVVIQAHDGGYRVAIIARLNRAGRVEWCLPKGHPEGEEDHTAAAEREVEEETGIAGHILLPLGSIDYWFTVPGHRIHKTVHHFLLEATGGYLTKDKDPDHEAIDVAWVELRNLPGKLSFPNERRIAAAAATQLSRWTR